MDELAAGPLYGRTPSHTWLATQCWADKRHRDPSVELLSWSPVCRRPSANPSGLCMECRAILSGEKP